MPNTPLFIVLEGPEGAGKSVQSRLLADWLTAAGHTVVHTREPGGTDAGDAIRLILLQSDHLELSPRSEALLVSAARAQHVDEVIAPALRRGDIVISDRFLDSTLVYQGFGHGLPQEELMQIQEFATGGLVPDIRLLLDLPVEIGLARRYEDSASVNRIDQAPIAYHQRVRAGYLELVRANSAVWDVIDASRSIDDVAAAIRVAVENRMNREMVHETSESDR